MSDQRTSIRATFDGPAELTATERYARRFCFTLHCAEGLPAGTRLRQMVGNFRTVLDNSFEGFRQWESFHADTEGGGALETISGPPRHFRDMGPRRSADATDDRLVDFALGVTEVTEPVPAGGIVRLELRGMPSHHAPLDARMFAQVSDASGEHFTTVGEIAALRGVPGEAVALVARLKAAPDADGLHTLHVHEIDELGNPTAPSLDPSALDVEIFGPGRRESTGVVIEGEGAVRVRIRDPQTDFEARTNPVQRDGFDDGRVYFGEFHWHTRFSLDGGRTPEEGYEYARDTLGLDFAGVTDHSPIQFWEDTLEINERYREDGRFVPLTAWEWSTPTGHSNIYLRHPDVPAGPRQSQTADHPGNAEWPDDAVVVPHHTNIQAAEIRDDGTPFWSEFNWSLPNQRVRLTEIVQTRGTFEADARDADWGIVTGGIGASTRDALAMGYRIGFVGGTDNHSGFPTRHADMGKGFGGMTCILAGALTHEALWQAMDERRTYATSGVPILANWSVNGFGMGREGRHSGEGARFSAVLRGTAPIERVEVLRDGSVVWRAHPDALDVEWTDEALPALAAGESAWYYLRLRQHDGHRAWLSPVWLDPA